ncbi:MAG: hypothetical protein P4L99_29915 [Chthoniobacter sp.]|nr:hypothetical protein [Chthoniobacter sp.]
MKTKTNLLLFCLLSLAFFSQVNAEPEKETRYLGFQIFTYFTPDPKVASLMSSGSKEPLVPGSPALRNYVLDIKQRIGAVGDPRTRLAFVLGPLCFEQTDAEVTKFIENAFNLALETDVAVGFHVDDSIFWARRKDLWSDPSNVEAMDWDGTPCTGRMLNWGKQPTEAPPQICFNSKATQREVQQRATLIGQAIQTGVKRLEQLKKPELFAGVIAGWETMIGQDFKTGKYLGYRALLNRGFSREHPPQDMDLERQKVVQEFIDLWTKGLADAGVSPQKIYSHTAFLSRRSFGLDDKKEVTYMRHDSDNSYSQHNHFAPPSVAFGSYHRPGFSTYPQPGLFDDIYDQLEKHHQVGWGSCEGTDMQPSSGPGQTGMNMETYLAKMFNHGATLVNIFSWGVGGEAMKTMGFRVVTEGDEALQAYRKFLRGEPLIEAKETVSLMERLPAKIHKMQSGLSTWTAAATSDNKDKATALTQKMQEQMKAKNWDEVEKTVDSLLELMGVSTQSAAQPQPATQPLAQPAAQVGASAPVSTQDITEEVRDKLAHNLGCSFLLFRTKVLGELKVTKEQKEHLDQYLQKLLPDAMQVLQKSNGERAKYNQKTHEEMAAVLKEILNENQRTRLHQLELQKDLLFGPTWNMKELQITDEQQKQFMAPTQETQKKTMALMAEIHQGANPEAIRPKAFQLRLDLEVQLEALLTDVQKKQWKEMLGQPVDPSIIYGGL